ncbi:MAG: hypothetical protein U9R49_03210, partial [Bacteroidota bacterium]|nr:hypothetical protein [Bacteroidota bacterium]
GMLCFLALGVKAQTTDEISFFQSIWGMEKKAIVESYMDLSETQAAAFWPVYEDYEVKRKELGKDKVNLLSDYAKNYGSMSGDNATDLIHRGAANNIAMQKLMKKTFNKLAKSLDPVTAAKFVQLENYFIVMIQMTIQESIPFIDEL